MSCPDHELLSAFADDELEPAAAVTIQSHLSNCSSCREFVQELRWVDTFGRSALGAIHPPNRPGALRLQPTSPRVWRPLALAAAAVLIGLSIAAWYQLSRLGERQSVSTPGAATTNLRLAGRIPPTESAGLVSDGGFTAASDEAFERWAEPYRRLRVPLLPLEEVGKHLPPEPPPAHPLSAEGGGTG